MTTAERTIASVRLPWFVGFLARRAMWGVITLLLFVTVLFFFMQAWVPYNWATQFGIGGGGAVDAAASAAGLDRPLPVRYFEFMGGLLTGDLGNSFSGAPVVDMILQSLPITLMVFVSGTMIGWVAGELLGRLGAWRRRRVGGSLVAIMGVLSATIFPPFLVFVLVRWFRFPLLDLRVAMGLPADSLDIWRGAVIGEPGFPTPNDVRWLLAVAFVVALVVALVVRSYARRKHLPVLGAMAIPVMLGAAAAGIWLSGAGTMALDLLYRADMTVTTGRGSPVLALLGVVLISFGQVMFMMRVGIEDERSEDYVLTARAKGLTERAVRDRHVARNALAPTLAGSFLAFPTVLAGMFIVELELEMTGLSSVLFNAIEFQDIPVIMGVMVALGLIGIGFRLLTDFSIAVLDPRQRRGDV
ncbi:MAG TPA: ABC transporter permease [Acidimicrobiia bacterium]|nr:ABC transporter permease [Acidimicrobiia bacterium]